MWCSRGGDDKGPEVRNMGRADKCFSVQTKSKILSNDFPHQVIFCNYQKYLANRVSYSVIKTFGKFYSKKLEIAFLIIFLHSKKFRLYRK